MAINISISKKQKLNKGLFLKALWTGVLAILVEFILNFFGIDILFGIFPAGFRLVFVTALSVTIASFLVVTYNNKEVI